MQFFHHWDRRHPTDLLEALLQHSPGNTYRVTTARSRPPARHKISAMARARQCVLCASEGCRSLREGKEITYSHRVTGWNSRAVFPVDGASGFPSHPQELLQKPQKEPSAERLLQMKARGVTFEEGPRPGWKEGAGRLVSCANCSLSGKSQARSFLGILRCHLMLAGASLSTDQLEMRLQRPNLDPGTGMR